MPTKVKEVMIRDVKTANADDTVFTAAETMNQHEIGCVVVTENGNPVGMITERDILNRIVLKGKSPRKTKTREVMSKPLITIKPNSTIKRAIHTMIKQNIKKLVISSSDKLVGVLSLTDLIPLLDIRDLDSDLSLKNADNRVKRVFEIYYDPIRQIRKRCPLTMSSGSLISCIGPKCMWYVNERCAMISFMEK